MERQSSLPGSSAAGHAPITNYARIGLETLPPKIAGMTVQELRDDYHDRIFNQYLPFWEKGGCDRANGGFVTELRDDGTVQTDEKYIWYQGRGLWVYAYLHRNFGESSGFLDIAKEARDFMVNLMYKGDGLWEQMVTSDGRVIDRSDQGSADDIYGSMFASAGLVEYHRASGDEEALEIALASIRKSIERYESPDYRGVQILDEPGVAGRSQGHAFMLVWTLTQLLSCHDDPTLAGVLAEHVDHIMNDFWNPDYGITNETLYHDYSRVPSLAGLFTPGHSIETLWMVMHEALRTGNRTLFDQCKNRIRRYIEMTWDYVFEGLGDTGYNVFGSDGTCAGPDFDTKNMWSECEALVGTMLTFEYTGDVWALEWYERVRAFTLRTMTTPLGVWRQAVDRLGNDRQRRGISVYRKDNFHQIRYQMYNLQSLERIIASKGKLTPFPS